MKPNNLILIAALLFLMLQNNNAQNKADLILSPDTISQNVGDTTDLILKLNLRGNFDSANGVDGVQAFINYDTADLEIIEIENVSPFNIEFFRDTMGTDIRFAGGILFGNLVTSNLDVLKIRVRAKNFAEIDSFVIDAGRSEVTSRGIGILDLVQDAFSTSMNTCYNSNGMAFRSGDNTFFQQDADFEGGTGVQDAMEIMNTDDDELFSNAREGIISYNIPLPKGVYNARFYYSDPDETALVRSMNIIAEDEALHSGFTIKSATIGSHTALIDSVVLNVQDDTLNLRFEQAAGSDLAPIISAICFDFNEVASLLPVELASFSAELRDDIVQLSWSSYSEVGFSHYEVERTNDLSSWERIGIVNGGHADYSFADRTAVAGKVNYYRLKMIDYITFTVLEYSVNPL